MQTNAIPRRAILDRARILATADDRISVAPADVIRAAIEVGFGTPVRPLPHALRGIVVAGCVMTAEDWQEAILAMHAGRYLYVGNGGAWTVDPSAMRCAA